MPVPRSEPLSPSPSPPKSLSPPSTKKFGRPPSRRYQPGAFTASQSGSHLSSSDHSAADRYALPPDFKAWGGGNDDPEPDDHLHNPDPARDRHHDKAGTIFTKRGLMNVGALAILAAALLTLFAG